MANAAQAFGTRNAEYGIWRVIMASSVGTMIEWYDFYIFGSLAIILGPKFYPPGNDTFAYIAYLATFAVGFLVRPFGALFFGRIGDLVGRKYAFIVTLSIMGFSTFAIGLLPSYATAGWFAPIVLLLIRVLQGLALGGEYGGAAVYVGEHVPDNKRGFYTSFIQITASFGFFLSLIAILATQYSMSKEDFAAYGWRIPFLVSIILVLISLYIRLKMKESPIFAQLKSTGMTSTQPLKDAFTKWPNLKNVLISLFGATAGQGVVWYTGQYYALFYMQSILKLNAKTVNEVVAIAVLIGMPFFTVVGALSDRIGRKKLMMAGCLLAALTYIPIYEAMERAAGNNIVTVTSTRDKVTGATKLTAMTRGANGALVPAKEAPNPNLPMLVLLVFVQVLYVCLVYGPIAAYLIEAFPAKIRYTSLSLPYHIGNGVFGGLLPLIGLWTVAATGNIYAGLYYPMSVAGMTFIVGSLLLRETRNVRIWDEAGKKIPAGG
ncbi:MAG: major facilitator superfamily transporter [Candidatus Sulfotelmatobacter sp.]|nr:major facilitator superfamily transporter [Candidatus Sulfotelmatobacter sp.]